MAIKNKRGFAFSLFAFFLVFLIYGFGTLYFFEGDYSKNVNFNEARIVYINNEITYFKDVYVKNVLSYSLYNTLNGLLNYSQNNYTFNQDYNKFNDLIKEGLINGSFNNNSNPQLTNKTISNFINLFQQNFEKNYRGKFDYKLIQINIYEKDPYYVSLSVIMQYNITTSDNISQWNILDQFDVSVPVFDLYDPQFLIQDNLIYAIRPAEYYKSGSNWSQNTLNETIINTYSSVYFEPDYKYSIGTSFINRFLNFSESSYKNVIAFWSFDFAMDNGSIKDSSMNIQNGTHYGNTKLLMRFDNNSAQDYSPYINTGILKNGLTCTYLGVFGNSCSFDGIDDYIQINSPKGLNFSDSFTINLWLKTGDSTSNSARIIRNTLANSGYDLFLSNGKVGVILNENQNYKIISSENISDNLWHLVTVTYNNNFLSLYVDSQLIDSISAVMTSPQTNTFYIGSNIGTSEFFKGNLDEIVLYSKSLSTGQIANLYGLKKAQFADYEDSLYGKGIEFDGIDDNVKINMTQQTVNNLTIEMWVKPYNLTSSSKKLVLINSPQIIINTTNNKLGTYINGLNDINGDGFYTSFSPITLNTWTYIFVVYDSSAKTLSIYINGNKNAVYSGKAGSPKINISSIGGIPNYYFRGIIDEVKIYNRTLSDNEININYHNYASSGKGCCNYLTLINSNKMGYNTTMYNKNISYSSKQFYDYYKRNKEFNNISLVRLGNFTSNITTSNYYNFKVDFCLMNAYNVFDYIGTPNIIEGKNNTLSCKDLIREGVY